MPHFCEYEDIDRDMSCWVVTALSHGTRLYLTFERVATDMLPHAMRFRDLQEAETTAKAANVEAAWSHFRWEARTVPAMIAEGRR